MSSSLHSIRNRLHSCYSPFFTVWQRDSRLFICSHIIQGRASRSNVHIIEFNTRTTRGRSVKMVWTHICSFIIMFQFLHHYVKDRCLEAWIGSGWQKRITVSSTKFEITVLGRNGRSAVGYIFIENREEGRQFLEWLGKSGLFRFDRRMRKYGY